MISRPTVSSLTPLARTRLDACARLAVLTCLGALAACADLKPPPDAQGGESSSTAGGGSGAAPNGPSGTGGVGGGDSSGGANGVAMYPGGGSDAASAGTSANAGQPGGGTGSSGPDGGGAGAGGAEPDGASSCQSKTDGGIRAWLYREITEPISNELHPFVALTNSASDVPLAEFAIRYYFSGEMSGDWQVECIWVTGGSGSGLCDAGTLMKVVSLDPPRAQADHYLEISFAQVSGATLSSVPTPVFEARSMLWRAGHPMLNQANDYSFTPTTDEMLNVESRAYRQTSRVTVYRNGALVWGEEPCP